VTLLAVGASAIVYAAGVRSLWAAAPGRGVNRWRAAAFAGGLLLVLVALASPLEQAAHELLSAHMVQHLVLILGAAPLLVLGRPVVVTLSALPPRGRRTIHRLGAGRPVRWVALVITTPVVAWVVHVSVVWAWHVPGAYQAALEHAPMHWLQHATFLGTALLFWSVALEPGSGRRLARGADVAYLLAAWLQSGALGALFTFAAGPIYPAYVSPAASLGVSPLQDQQLAGLIMWIPAGLVYLSLAGVLFVSWLRRIEDDQRRADQPATGPEATEAALLGGVGLGPRGVVSGITEADGST
jgi:putative membrane protein